MLVAVLSVKGSPGVTTFSVALAARWPSPSRALLVEADPSGGDVGTRFSLESAPGLVSLAVAARRSDDPALLWQHAQALPGGLPVVAAPPDADRARAALSALADPTTGAGVLRTAASAPDAVVIVDCGRIDAGSPAMPIVRSADAMVLLTRAHADDLAHLARRLPAIGRWTAHPAMLLVGEGYSTAEVARELGVLPLGRVPDDPHGAAVLCGRPSTLRWGRSGPAHSALGQVAHKVAKVLIAEQAPPPALPRQAPADNQPMSLLRAVPGVPTSPVSANGLRLAPAPLPPNTENTSRGGQAS
ncbi:MinD-like ATPase involved in chromosome partitioning or flagellar assembly [Crossiella equi]|uniref:MinD-like ATPase involved in chromosome partitioning or flagellar assembly n=1 Tax=Crossiella equi TaxID=130796 RepID=A0ABS5AE31_9PSEU|nr:chromosome partitioning protein [Crossiella equi]MBP2474844.1 MinD-like ATPase involved in chromosome partitioning or flagellar assembly [Crossiella equi]